MHCSRTQTQDASKSSGTQPRSSTPDAPAVTMPRPQPRVGISSLSTVTTHARGNSASALHPSTGIERRTQRGKREVAASGTRHPQPVEGNSSLADTDRGCLASIRGPLRAQAKHDSEPHAALWTRTPQTSRMPPGYDEHVTRFKRLVALSYHRGPAVVVSGPVVTHTIAESSRYRQRRARGHQIGTLCTPES